MKTRYVFAAFAGFLLLSGCNIAPKYQKPVAIPPAAFPASFKELAGNEDWKAAAPSDELGKGNWWEVFGDPLLNELESNISISNQSVKQAEAQFRASRALVDLQRAGFFPTVGSNSQISQNQSNNGLGRTTTTSVFTLPINASWEADIWGRIRTAVEGQTASAQASAATLENARLSLQSTLAIDYFTLESIDMQAKILDDTIAAYQQYLQLTTNRFNGGVASRADVALAQTQLATTTAQRTDLGVTRAQFEHAIAVLMGRPPAGFSIPARKIGAPPPTIPVAIPSILLERRPDIAAAERAIAVQNANVGLAKIAFYPTVTLSGSGLLQGNNLQNLFSMPLRSWTTGSVVNDTVFDFGRRNATIDQAVANYDAAVAAYRQTVLAAFQEVEDNLATLRILAQEATEQQAAVASAEQSLALVTDRYKAGIVSYLDIITTQTIALNNERAAVTILQRRMTAAATLVKALGGGWDNSTLPTYDQLRSTELADPDFTKQVAQPANMQPPTK